MGYSQVPSILQTFYANKVIFITGATGSLGKFTVEKLLRVCSNLDKIYILIRPTRFTIEDRLKSFFTDEIFTNLRTIDTNLYNKIVPIKGNIEEPNLGLSQEDESRLISSTHIVFHLAAAVNFNQKLSKMVHANLRGTQSVLELSRKMRNLQVVIHCSSFVSSFETDYVEQRICKNIYSMNWKELLTCPNLDEQPSNLIGNSPSNYAFVKFHTEEMVSEYQKDNLPVGIIRQSAFSSAAYEPTPGWSHPVLGHTSLFYGINAGVIRVLPFQPTAVAIITPIDMTANALLACAWHTFLVSKNSPERGIQVYNHSFPKNKLTNDGYWRIICSHLARLSNSDNPPTIILEPDTESYNKLMHLNDNKPIYQLRTFNADKSISSRHLKLHQMVKFYEPLMCRDWNWESSNIDEIWKSLKIKDKMLFPFNFTDMNVEEYVRNHAEFIASRHKSLIRLDSPPAYSKL